MRQDPIIDRRFEELTAKAEQVAQSRELDFTSTEGVPYYKIPTADLMAWATNVQNLFNRTFGPDSVHARNFDKAVEDFSGWESSYDVCRGVFLAAKEDHEGGYLFNVRVLAKVEVLSDALSQARELLRAGYKDPACILGRVALEVALAELADAYAIHRGKLDKMNADLCKAGVYNMAKQKQVTAWADIGNKAAHGDWTAYSDADADAMVVGVEALIADLL